MFFCYLFIKYKNNTHVLEDLSYIINAKINIKQLILKTKKYKKKISIKDIYLRYI